jgi:hypothetical protein
MIKKKKKTAIKAKPKAKANKGTYKNSKRCVYISESAGRVELDSTWELEYVKYLDKNKIKWKRNQIKFPYHYNKKLCYYIPDFFLVKEDIYVEVKGYENERDEAKWRDFPYKLIVLRKDDLLTLGLDIK